MDTDAHTGKIEKVDERIEPITADNAPDYRSSNETTHKESRSSPVDEQNTGSPVRQEDHFRITTALQSDNITATQSNQKLIVYPVLNGSTTINANRDAKRLVKRNIGTE